MFFHLLFFIFFVVNSVQAQQELPRILLVYPWDLSITIGGGIMHTLHHAHMLKHHHHTPWIMTHRGSSMAVCSQAANIPTLFFSASDYNESDFARACDEFNIDVVITPEWRDLALLKKMQAKKMPSVIYVRHMTIDGIFKKNIEALQGIDAVVCVNPTMENEIKKLNLHHNLGIKEIVWIAPFWDEQACEDVCAYASREQFFDEQFHIKIQQGPLLCMVANMINPCKNYPLLMAALQELIQKKRKSIQAIFAGDGPLKPDLEVLAQKLGIAKYLYFIGSTKKVPALLSHIDMHVLASNAEGFPIVNLEAAARKKPIIASRDTGAAHLIIDKKTGLLFKKNDKQDLVRTIETLLDNPEVGGMLGRQAYDYVQDRFTNAKLFDAWQNLFNKILIH